MNSKEYEHLFLELNSVLVKFWRANGRPDKELRIQLLERMLDWYKKAGTITQDLVKQELPASLDEAARSICDELYLKEGKRDPYGNPYFLPDALMQAVFAGAELVAGQFQKNDGNLEKEAEAYWKAQGGGSHAQWDKFRAVVKHFTEWQKEQKPAWSEEDERKIVELKTIIAQCNGFNKENRKKAFDMIDALRPQFHWKPSEEQMKALEQAKISAECGNFFTKDGLKSLYEQLEKL